MTESENHLNGENDGHCIICDQAGWDANLSTKGFLSIISSSKKRQDGKHEQLLPLISNKQALVVHEQCRKSYTSSKNIHYFLKKRNYELDTLPPRNLRTLQINFDFKTHCLICAECINFPNVEKNPKRQSIGSVEIVDKLDKCSTLQNTLLELCSKRSDKQALDVKSRIICAGDIRAAEAIYHRQCLQTFLRCKQDCDTNERNLNLTNSEGFSNLCTWLSSQTGSQFTISDLQVKLSSFLPEDVEPYSVKHLKRKLQDHFGNKLSITELGGKKNVFQFRHTASEILHQAFLTDDQEDGDELIAESRQLGKKLRNLLSDIKFDTEHFPSPDELNINALESQVPEALLVFMKSLLGLSSTSSDRNTLQMISLCHILMNAVAPNPYQSPLLFSTGLFIHQTTRSKLVLNLLSALGMTVSYDTILEFERSAVTSRNTDDLHPGIGVNEDGTEGFCQWIADNFDYNEDTISGHNSTHVMGIIACQTPASTQKLSVRRQKTYATDILAAGDFSNIQPYRNHHTNAMAKVKFHPVVEVIVPKLKHFLFQDTVWMLSNFRSQITPGWQGFMSDVTHGEYMQSKVLYHPMIPLNPQTNEAVFSTMMFVDKQRQKIGQCCALLTFDQPLYAKAYKIKTENPLDFKHIQLRLGGFHQLMSFLGSGCKSMQYTGLEELWSCVYAKNSIPKMFEGKSYHKTVRACLLTCAALHILLFEQPHEDIMDEDGDNREHENDSVGSDSLSDIEQIAKDISSREIQFDDFEETVDNILGKVDKEKAKHQQSRTSKLWLQFMDFVSTMCMFIRAERTGDWLLHLKASQDMLPWFAATGHNNYAKYCRLYIQDFVNPCPCLHKPLEDGLFTIHRSQKLFWSGTWSDMVIEQSLMRSGKTSGGLINITHKDSARTRWLLSAHIVAQYTEELRMLTNTSSNSWSDHHRELNPGRMNQDYIDMNKFLDFLRSHNPFTGVQSELRNIATCVIADDRVNADRTVSIGSSIQSLITNHSFGDVSMKKSQQVVTFDIMKRAVTLTSGERLRMSSLELYQRLLAIAYTIGPPSPSVFCHELSSVAPALFHDDGSMRKSTKSQLAKCIMKMISNVETDLPSVSTVFDGCALLQQLKWPKVGTMLDVCEIFLSSIHHRSSLNHEVTVVFDSYDVTTTKDQEQKRRKLSRTAMADIMLKSNTPVPSDAASFLANKKNKQQTINLLSSYIQENSRVLVSHAGDEGDADVVIVQRAVDLAEKHETVHVISDDTDIFVLLIHHVDSQSNVYMKTRSRTMSIKEAKHCLGEQLCHNLPFLHAVSGCDTTSSFFGFGKSKHLAYFTSAEQLHEKVRNFGESSVPLQVIKEVGEQYVCGLYGGKQNEKLDELRFKNVKSTKFTSVERMPPTSRACYFHCLRVHLQVSTWKSLKTVLDKETHGFKSVEGSIVPVITDMPPAPPELLKEIKCSCKSSNRLCTSCSCVKRGIQCSIHCKCESNCENRQDLNAEYENY